MIIQQISARVLERGSSQRSHQGPQLTGPDQFDDRFRPDQFHRTRPDQSQDQTRPVTGSDHFSQDQITFHRTRSKPIIELISLVWSCYSYGLELGPNALGLVTVD